jgi:predicted nucleic acid-binding Zn ribbon protein
MAPRKPAHLRTLEFREAAEFLQKLNREIARVRDVKETTDVIDHATNAAMTAWYLTDWVWHDIEEDRTAAPFRLLAKTAGKPIRSLQFSDIRTRCERGCSVLRKHRSRQQAFRLKWSGILICCATAHRGNERPSKSYRINIHYKPLGYRSAAYADDRGASVGRRRAQGQYSRYRPGARDWWSDLFDKIKLA